MERTCLGPKLQQEHQSGSAELLQLPTELLEPTLALHHTLCGALTDRDILPGFCFTLLSVSRLNPPRVFVGWDSARRLDEGKSAGEDVVSAELPTKLLLDREGWRWEQILPVGEGCQELGLFIALGCTEAPEEPGCHTLPGALTNGAILPGFCSALRSVSRLKPSLVNC